MRTLNFTVLLWGLGYLGYVEGSQSRDAHITSNYPLTILQSTTASGRPDIRHEASNHGYLEGETEIPAPNACGPDHSAVVTHSLQCARYLSCAPPVITCDPTKTAPPRPTITTLTRIDGCTTTLSVGSPCVTCPTCRPAITYQLGGPGC